MKKGLLLSMTMVAATMIGADADIIVNFQCEQPESIDVMQMPIEVYAKQDKGSDLISKESLKAEKSMRIATPDYPAYCFITAGDPKDGIPVFIAPGETVVVEVKGISPIDAAATGTPLMDGMNTLDASLTPIVAELQTLYANGTPEEKDIMAIYDKYDTTAKQFIKNNSDNPAAVMAALRLIENNDQLEYLDALETVAQNSIIYPIANASREQIKKQLALEEKQKQLESGDVLAPDFTLPSLDGTKVSLSDFRGKWVVIDFWGSWCRWCIKGFPDLKEAYKKYDGKLEVIGVDCGDTEDQWRTAVKKYELPWVQVYNGSDNSITAEYGIQGFPTKAIVNPEGKIVNITVGEDPQFFTILDNLINR